MCIVLPLNAAEINRAASGDERAEITMQWRIWMQKILWRCPSFLTSKPNSTQFNSIQLRLILWLILLPFGRFAIRDQLRLGAQLPHGIKVLPVPSALKRYVDLMEADSGDDWWMDGWVGSALDESPNRVEQVDGTEVEVKEILRSLLLITTICGLFVLMVLWIDWT